jgi:hypothetical protein
MKNTCKIDNMKPFRILMLFLLTSLSATAQVEVPSDWMFYEDDSFSIRYPNGFEVGKSTVANTSFILLSKSTSSKDQFRENVNVLVQDLTGLEMDLDQFTNVSENQVTSLLTKGKILESRRITTDSSEFHRLVYVCEQGDLKLIFVQHYWIINGKSYILTFTGEAAEFKKYDAVSQVIMASFRIK